MKKDEEGWGRGRRSYKEGTGKGEKELRGKKC